MPKAQRDLHVEVLPKKKILGGTNTIWEYILASKGWNDLSPRDKVGIVDGVYVLNRSENHLKVLDIYFPALDLMVQNVFPDEVYLV